MGKNYHFTELILASLNIVACLHIFPIIVENEKQITGLLLLIHVIPLKHPIYVSERTVSSKI